MNIPTDSCSTNSLYCELCDSLQFSSYEEFHYHHLQHVRQPTVALVKLNRSLCDKLELTSYKVNTGVARRSVNSGHISPLKISLKKHQGTTQFQVVKKESFEFRESSEESDDSYNSLYYKYKTESVTNTIDAGAKERKEVEGKSLLERFGANISISRKGTPITPVPKIKEEPADENDQKQAAVEKLKKENLLERLSGYGGISISAKPKIPSTNGNADQDESKTSSGISLLPKSKPIDLNQFKSTAKENDSDAEKKLLEKNLLLQKLSGIGGISIAPKKLPPPPEAPKEKEESDDNNEDEETDEDDDESKIKNDEKPSSETESTEKSSKSDVGSPNNEIKTNSKTESQDSNDSSNSKASEQTCKSAGLEQKDNTDSSNSDNDNREPRKHVRVKNSNVSKRDFENEKQRKSPSEAGFLAEGQETSRDVDKEDADKPESGIDILERLTDNLSNSVGLEKPDEGNSQQKASQQASGRAMEEANLPSPTPGEQLHPDFLAPPSDCNSPIVRESEYGLTEETNIPNEANQDCGSLMMTPPNSTQDSTDSSTFNSVNCQDTYSGETFDEPQTINEDDEGRSDVTVAFTSLQNEDQSQLSGEQPIEQPIEQPNYWTDVRNSTNNLDQPQQDPLMTGDGAANGDMSQSFLHNFLSDPQPAQNSMPPHQEGNEYVSYDSLGQGLEGQHPPPPYDPNAPDPTAPMEQLSQQVQRMPNPPSQISVIPQHHMQAPQPPQLHAGMPMPPQHMSPQPPNSYDPLAHMQPPMPPPLYQGFNMFNQNYQPPTPQQIPPRPPTLQQRPQQRITPRPFQSMAAIPQVRPPPRPRALAVKRTMPVRFPGPQEMTPPKQRRMDPQMPGPGRPGQQQSPAARIPLGITVTPPKKNAEANKVANVLASRGITVTPAANRQGAQNNVRQQQRPGVPQQVLNLGSQVSITSSQQNRTSGGFAVPGPRRSGPVVNHNIERPERCTTVDLTLDDDPPQIQRNRPTMGRFSCPQCSKIFTSTAALESHKAVHRAAGTLAFKCDKCTAQYPTSMGLQQHKLTFHKTKQVPPDLAIPIVDLNHPGAKEQLSKCGIHSFLPLSQLQSNSNGYFGIPIINLDSAKEKAVSNLNILGAGNIFVLGRMKTLTPQGR